MGLTAFLPGLLEKFQWKHLERFAARDAFCDMFVPNATNH